MIKKTIHTAITLLALSVAFAACQDEREPEMPRVPDGYVNLQFSTDVPAMQEVVTRAVDDDGKGVQDMTLFCFDSYGLFISTTTATLASTSETTGSFNAQVPDHTRTIHFVGNQNMNQFPENSFANKSEAEVMALLQGSSGRMIYWARFACAPDNEAKIDAQLQAAGSRITLIRNHALVTVAENTAGFTVQGFKVYNTNAFGTVAPYHPTKGFDFAWPSTDDAFVTLPDNKAKMSDVREVTTELEQYVFECENKEDDPVSVILYGRNAGDAQDLYYRVMMVDANGEQILIRRNHKYIVTIVGKLSYGQATFEEALTAAATNNVWVAISDDVKEVSDGACSLSVEQTSYVIDSEQAPGTGYNNIRYTVTAATGTLDAEADKPTVTWLEGNNVASATIGNSFTVNGATGEGQINITTFPLGENEDRLEGTLLVKKGRLQRKIKIIKMKKQTFKPAWMGAQLYGNIGDAAPAKRPKATAVFTIPETCPQELFPMKVLVSANDLDVRAASGMKLSVINKGDEGYGADGTLEGWNTWGYKYVYIAEAPGVQRIYLESILTQTDGAERQLTIEAEHFERMNLKFHFSEKLATITLEGLNEYDGNEDPNAPNDEHILYRLVPQKKHANVQFDMQMRDLTEAYEPGDPFNAGPNDEFLIYMSNLMHYAEGEEAKAGVTEFECEFHHSEATAWSQQNNANGGTACMFTPKNPVKPEGSTGKYSVFMYTTKAKSAEVVRIASNLNTLPAVLDKNNNAEGKYKGNTYRSVIFELANYNPFRFAAQVTYNNTAAVGYTDATGDTAEPMDALEWDYEPGLPVDIEIDVTSFEGSDGKSADPFGEPFDIYIDAPMLEIDNARLGECKLTPEKLQAAPGVPGRFVYRVDANREQERAFGVAAAMKPDNTAGVDQAGERKKLPFKVKEAVSAGDITVSSDKEWVIYFDKTFRVSNRSITGTLRYRKADGTELDVPARTFVPFERVSNNSRIGAVTVPTNGTFDLRLRKEYEFNWNTDRVEFRCEIDGVTYRAEVASLAILSGDRHVVLEPAD